MNEQENTNGNLEKVLKSESVVSFGISGGIPLGKAKEAVEELSALADHFHQRILKTNPRFGLQD